MTSAALPGLRARRVLVMGGSSGIGRAIAVGAGAAGASVVVAARRAALVEQVAEESRAAGAPSAHGLVCDAADPDDAAAAGPRASELLGGLDTIVYSTGTAPLASVSATSAADWRQMLDTNLVGAAMVLVGALEPLRASAAVADVAPAPTFVVLSTHTTARPWPGLVPYAATKSALETLCLGLRAEEPWLRVVNVVVGNTTTGFADGWDSATATTALERWLAEGYLSDPVYSAEEMATVVLQAIAEPTGPDEIDVVSDARARAGTDGG
ncbi:MAG TPA: SDR family NAD(P)-dependent oxidoreductase [Acidimicrobiales bacterium]|nr:SDR family NAD(P)-dependent oxidoreductase [Acidimicrobiales bacterium]